MRLAVLIAAALVLAGPALAQAADNARFAENTKLMRRAQAIAERKWGEVPCSGDVEIWWDALDDTDTLAVSFWRGGWREIAERWRCRAIFNTQVAFTWPMFCSIVVHEYGHLLGYEHSANPRSVMYPEYVRAYGPCRRR